MIKETKEFVFFYYGDDIYSNFYRANFNFAGINCFCSEQAFMWAKAVFFKDYITAAKIAAVDPSKKNAAFTCKMLGREVKPYNDSVWQGERFNVMVHVLKAKFGQNPKLMDELAATGGKHLVEASPTDTIWGVGMDVDHPDIQDSSCWRGFNLLGEALMVVRLANWRDTQPVFE